MLNFRASGARLGPDQKGVPFELTCRPDQHRSSSSQSLKYTTHLVLGQVVQQLLDLVDIVGLVLQPRPLDALRKCGWSLFHEVLFDLLELLVVLSTGLEGRLDKVGLREVQVDRGWRVDIERIERFSSPLHKMDGQNHSRKTGASLPG